MFAKAPWFPARNMIICAAIANAKGGLRWIVGESTGARDLTRAYRASRPAAAVAPGQMRSTSSSESGFP
jgi:hypothetical protein